jgi:hypothetical protein
VGEVVAVEGQVEPVLVGQLGQNPGVVFLGHVRERLELVRVEGVVEDRYLQPDQGSGGHLDQLPLAQDGLARKALDVGVERVADVDHPDASFRCQAAVANPFEDLPDFSWQLGQASETAAPEARFLVPAQREGRFGRVLKQGPQGRLYRGSFLAGESAQVGEALRLDLHLAGDAPLSGCGHRHQVALSEGGLHLRQPLRIGWSGPVDHQEPGQELLAPRLHRQAVAREDLLRPRVPEEQEFPLAEGFFSRFPLPHRMIVSQGASGEPGQIKPSFNSQLGLP